VGGVITPRRDAPPAPGPVDGYHAAVTGLAAKVALEKSPSHIAEVDVTGFKPRKEGNFKCNEHWFWTKTDSH